MDEVKKEETVDILKYKKFSYDERYLFPGWEKYEKEAEEIKRQYDEDIQAILTACAVKYESEIFTGCILKPPKYSGRKREKEQKHRLTEMSRKVLGRYEKIFKKSIENDEDYLQKASAWYHVTYKRQSENEKVFLGLPWIVGKHLSKIREIMS